MLSLYTQRSKSNVFPFYEICVCTCTCKRRMNTNKKNNFVDSGLVVIEGSYQGLHFLSYIPCVQFYRMMVKGIMYKYKCMYF